MDWTVKLVLPETYDFIMCFSIPPVPDNKSRNIPEVVLVRRWAVGVLGIWRGGGGEMGEVWGKWGKFTSNLRLRWTIPVTARRVPSK
jgi:hypothetical protein